jgi:hypothetical protein
MNEEPAPRAPQTGSICTVCPLCGGPNACKPAQTANFEGEPCWCTSVHFSKSMLERVPRPLKGKACICQACATQATAEISL